MSTVAKLWANRIIAGLKKYEDVPAKLKDEVKEILIELGHAELI